MKKLILAFLLVFALSFTAFAGNEKINPTTYLCAELISEPVIMKGEPPLFQVLQIDGYASADVKMTIASSDTVTVMTHQLFAMCQPHPTEKVYTLWRELRETGPVPTSGWDAEQATCRDYALNPDDGSGFIIWLDGYNRKIQDTEKSILNSDKDVQEFIDACMMNPSKRMIDVLREHAK